MSRPELGKTKILENLEFVFLKEDIHRFISSTELLLSDIRGLRYTGFKKSKLFCGTPGTYTAFPALLGKLNLRCQNSEATLFKKNW